MTCSARERGFRVQTKANNQLVWHPHSARTPSHQPIVLVSSRPQRKSLSLILVQPRCGRTFFHLRGLEPEPSVAADAGEVGADVPPPPARSTLTVTPLGAFVWWGMLWAFLGRLRGGPPYPCSVAPEKGTLLPPALSSVSLPRWGAGPLGGLAEDRAGQSRCWNLPR